MLEDLDLSLDVGRKEFEKELAGYQVELVGLQRKIVDQGRRVIIGFEGWDAAGKGGAIKRLILYMDPRGYEVHPIGPPTDMELKHHYLRRFWQRLPARGKLTIFDRTWYGRVLVERVEGFASKAEWKRAYDEINDFERVLVDDGYLLLKFFLHISSKEQLRRFKARQADPLKQWKITEDDWRNRKKRPQYLKAVEDMLARTHTETAPWTLVEADSKRYARLKVVRTVIGALRAMDD
ncbi:MAG TPA: UDP-galactose-lipid carrier transferase [Armatimonadota bacterium]|nr:UDP-galactose-lipid carrier transferase [Armatimonadota bacterium]HQK92205.1 UDP-galactose-lipid carrier transferase [Armatimonadota bacterium]